MWPVCHAFTADSFLAIDESDLLPFVNLSLFTDDIGRVTITVTSQSTETSATLIARPCEFITDFNSHILFTDAAEHPFCEWDFTHDHSHTTVGSLAMPWAVSAMADPITVKLSCDPGVTATVTALSLGWLTDSDCRLNPPITAALVNSYDESFQLVSIDDCQSDGTEVQLPSQVPVAVAMRSSDCIRWKRRVRGRLRCGIALSLLPSQFDCSAMSQCTGALSVTLDGETVALDTCFADWHETALLCRAALVFGARIL